MTAATGKRIAALEAGLAFASAAHRPAIRAMIAELRAGGGEEVHHADTEDAEARPSRNAARADVPGLSERCVDTERADDAPCPPCLRGEPAADAAPAGAASPRTAADDAPLASAVIADDRPGGDGDRHVSPALPPAAVVEPEPQSPPIVVPPAMLAAAQQQFGADRVVASQPIPLAAALPALPVCPKCKRPFARGHHSQRYCGPECQQQRRRAVPRQRQAEALRSARIAARQTSSLYWRERAAAMPAAEAEPKQMPPVRGRFPLVWNKAVVIGPPLPAPVKYDGFGEPYFFQDDLAAIADHGSPGVLYRPASPGWNGTALGTLYRA